MAHVFTDADFTSEVLQAPGLAVIDFFAEWCGPCKMMAPTIDEMAEEMSDVKIGKLDVDLSPQTAQNYGVSSIPTLIFFKGGQEVGRTVGFQSKEAIEAKIAQFK
ncbi:MAG: thioredoxin [Patescibacteria group bacterium]